MSATSAPADHGSADLFRVSAGIILDAHAFVEYAAGAGAHVTTRNPPSHRRVKRSVDEQKAFLGAVINAIPTPVLVKDDKHVYVAVNDAFAAFFQRSADEIIGKNDYDFFKQEDARFYQDTDRKALQKDRTVEYERAYTIDGLTQWMFVRKSPLTAPDGRRLVVLVLIDVTQRLAAERAVSKNEARFRALTELSSDWYWQQDENHRFTEMSPEVLKAVGVSPRLHIGKTRWELPGIMLSEKDWAVHKALLAAHQPFSDFTYERVGPDGETRYLSISGGPMFDEQGKFIGYRGVGKNVTAAKLAEVRIQYLAHHDSLTALPNRSSFNLILNHGIARARRDHKKLALLFLDLDRFKNINDTLGHDAGDALLREIGSRLKHCIRQSDTVARLGGDEFVVLLEEIGAAGHVARMARKILSDIASSLQIGGQEFHVTASIGISTYPEDGEDEQSLLKNADIAMYHAKQQGKNNFQFHSPQMTAHSQERLAMESGLRHALERNELRLHYQPKMNIGTSRMTGMEALLRWQHPDIGMGPPAQFISIADETGLIGPIGQWVIRTACLQNKAWQDQGLPAMRVAINLSPRQFTDVDLPKSIAVILNETGMDATWLELEITESMLMHNVDKTMRRLTALGKMGIRIAIDNFGTGHSSPAHLKRFPIDTLKIDRSFISDLPGDAEDRAITAAIIAMGKSLELTLVAEGVETQGQLDFLRAHGCAEFQGYYSSKPLPAEQLEQLLQTEKDLSQRGA